MSLLENKLVLVTGASGLLGGHLVRRLLNRGTQVVAMVHDAHKDTFLSIEGIRPHHIVQGDITDLHRMRQIFADYELDYVFHTAANPIVRKCIRDPIGCFRTNIMGTANVLEAAIRTGTVRGVLCMESDKSYGSFDEAELPYKEDQALKPASVYEVSKACAGFIAKAYDHDFDLPTFTVRGANLYGPGDMNLSRLIPGTILRVLRGEPPVVYEGVAHYKREFLYVEDAAEVCCRLMENLNATRGRAFNLGSGQVYTVKQIVDTICKRLGSDLTPRIVSKGRGFNEIPEQWLDLSRLREIIQDYAFVSLEDGLDHTITWYRQLHEKGSLGVR